MPEGISNVGKVGCPCKHIPVWRVITTQSPAERNYLQVTEAPTNIRYIVCLFKDVVNIKGGAAGLLEGIGQIGGHNLNVGNPVSSLEVRRTDCTGQLGYTIYLHCLSKVSRIDSAMHRELLAVVKQTSSIKAYLTIDSFKVGASVKGIGQRNCTPESLIHKLDGNNSGVTTNGEGGKAGKCLEVKQGSICNITGDVRHLGAGQIQSGNACLVGIGNTEGLKVNTITQGDGFEQYTVLNGKCTAITSTNKGRAAIHNDTAELRAVLNVQLVQNTTGIDCDGLKVLTVNNAATGEVVQIADGEVLVTTAVIKVDGLKPGTSGKVNLRQVSLVLQVEGYDGRASHGEFQQGNLRDGQVTYAGGTADVNLVELLEPGIFLSTCNVSKVKREGSTGSVGEIQHTKLRDWSTVIYFTGSSNGLESTKSEAVEAGILREVKVCDGRITNIVYVQGICLIRKVGHIHILELHILITQLNDVGRVREVPVKHRVRGGVCSVDPGLPVLLHEVISLGLVTHGMIHDQGSIGLNGECRRSGVHGVCTTGVHIITEGNGLSIVPPVEHTVQEGNPALEPSPGVSNLTAMQLGQSLGILVRIIGELKEVLQLVVIIEQQGTTLTGLLLEVFLHIVIPEGLVSGSTCKGVKHATEFIPGLGIQAANIPAEYRAGNIGIQGQPELIVVGREYSVRQCLFTVEGFSHVTIHISAILSIVEILHPHVIGDVQKTLVTTTKQAVKVIEACIIISVVP